MQQWPGSRVRLWQSCVVPSSPALDSVQSYIRATSELHPSDVRATSEPRPNHVQATSEPHPSQGRPPNGRPASLSFLPALPPSPLALGCLGLPTCRPQRRQFVRGLALPTRRPRRREVVRTPSLRPCFPAFVFSPKTHPSPVTDVWPHRRLALPTRRPLQVCCDSQATLMAYCDGAWGETIEEARRLAGKARRRTCCHSGGRSSCDRLGHSGVQRRMPFGG